MKLILAIVNNDDSALASCALTDAGFSVTRLSTTGGFLMVGNTTLLIGTEDAGVEQVLEILKQHCTSHNQAVPAGSAFPFGGRKKKITVGGATVFVLDVDYMEKI